MFVLRFYLFIHERHTQRKRQRHGQREKQAPRREPDMGLDPGSPESRPGLQAALNRCATGAAQNHFILRDIERLDDRGKRQSSFLLYVLFCFETNVS